MKTEIQVTKTTVPCTYQSTRIRVNCISRNVHEGHLYEIFGEYGKIKLVDLHKDPKTEFHRGFAYIEYEHDQCDYPVQKAIEAMDGGQIDGLIIKVQEAADSSLHPHNRYKNNKAARYDRSTSSSSSSYCSTCSSSLSSISSASRSSISYKRYKSHRQRSCSSCSSDSFKRGRSRTPVSRKHR